MVRPGDLERSAIVSAAGPVARGSAVVPDLLGRRQLLPVGVGGQLVQALRDSLGRAPVVDEDERGGVLAHEIEQLRVDRGPDRAGVRRIVEVRMEVTARRLLRFAPGGGGVRPGSRIRHVLHRNTDLDVERLAAPGVDKLALALRPDEELPDSLQRPLCGREADALRILPSFSVNAMREPLEGQREVCPALRGGDGVDLVDDHGLDAPEHVSRT